MSTSAPPNVLELLVPGLLGPIPPLPGQSLSTPTLDLLLARGRQSAAASTDLTTALLARFGADASAPYSLAADDPGWDHAGYCMHAAPVHLRPDRDLLRLFDARHLGISQEDADGLTAELNAHFAADGLRFTAPTPSRWYLFCGQPPAMQSQPLELVIGQHVDGLLPTGDDAARWAQLMNEAQMLLFQSPVNQQREASGRPPVNGLWTWGGGVWRALADAAPSARLPAHLQARLPLALGLAAAAGAPAEPPDAPWKAHASSHLVVLEQFRDALLDRDDAAWSAAAEALDRWLAPAVDALRAGRLDEISIDACDGRRWSLYCPDLRRFGRRCWRRMWGWPWRRSKALADLAQQSTG
jgi:hypothetical protein